MPPGHDGGSEREARVRRIGVLGLCRDDQDRVLMVPAAGASDVWTLPGGQIPHGENPLTSMRRYLPPGAGRSAGIGAPVTVVTDIDSRVHTDWVVLRVALTQSWAPGTAARWCRVTDIEQLRLAPASAKALGLPSRTGTGDDVSAGRVAPEAAQLELEPAAESSPAPARWRQRFAVYALATDPAGRVLLARISDGYPGAGHWHLPGGGTDAGESAEAGLLRELIEETNQRGRLGEPLSVSHRHQRDAMGPEGVPINWQGIRVVYRVHIDAPTPARVVEGAGSTVEAEWFMPTEALRLDLTEVARESIARHLC